LLKFSANNLFKNANLKEMAQPIKTFLTNSFKNNIWQLFAGDSHQVR
jgi:hypothetical protein